MIFNLIKHLIMALLLDAGAAMAFDIEANEPAPAATSAVPAQSCSVPAPQTSNNALGMQP